MQISALRDYRIKIFMRFLFFPIILMGCKAKTESNTSDEIPSQSPKVTVEKFYNALKNGDMSTAASLCEFEGTEFKNPILSSTQKEALTKSLLVQELQYLRYSDFRIVEEKGNGGERIVTVRFSQRFTNTEVDRRVHLIAKKGTWKIKKID